MKDRAADIFDDKLSVLYPFPDIIAIDTIRMFMFNNSEDFNRILEDKLNLSYRRPPFEVYYENFGTAFQKQD